MRHGQLAQLKRAKDVEVKGALEVLRAGAFKVGAAQHTTHVVDQNIHRSQPIHHLLMNLGRGVRRHNVRHHAQRRTG